MPSVINPPTPVNVNITIHLTDGDVSYDVKNIHVGELGKFNETTQRETDGEMWWEPITQPQDTKETYAVTAVLRALVGGKRLEECRPDDLWYLHGWLENAAEATSDLFNQVETVLQAMRYEPAGHFYDGASVLYGV